MNSNLLRLAAASAVLIGCGTTISDDVAADSGTDGSMDSGKIDGGADGGKDSSVDAGDGSVLDAPDDSSDAALLDSSSGDGGFDVGSLQGLALWLDAAKGVTKNNQNQVSKWADQSANGNDASQGMQSRQPVFNTNVINGLPALHFDQSATQVLNIADASSLQWGTADFTVEVVARFDNNANNMEFGTLYGKVGSSSGIFFVANNVNQSAAGITGAIDSNNILAVSSSYNDNTARSYAFRRVGSNLELRANGAQILSQAQSGNVDVSASGTGVIIGDYNQQLPLDGDIAEIVAVKGSISAQDLTALEAYFKAKYNL